LDGYFIVKITVKKAQKVHAGIKFKKNSAILYSAVITDLLADNQLLTVILIKITEPIIATYTEPLKLGNLKHSKVFNLPELEAYLQKSGDKNPIHSQPSPIIPGLMILDLILTKKLTSTIFFTIKFLNPLSMNIPIQFYENKENVIIGLSNDKIICQFTPAQI
jgi:hypothetical protein